MPDSPSAEEVLKRELGPRWRFLQAAYIVGAGLLVVPVYPLLQADLTVWAVLYGALAIVALTYARHRVLAYEQTRLAKRGYGHGSDRTRG